MSTSPSSSRTMSSRRSRACAPKRSHTMASPSTTSCSPRLPERYTCATRPPRRPPHRWRSRYVLEGAEGGFGLEGMISGRGPENLVHARNMTRHRAQLSVIGLSQHPIKTRTILITPTAVQAVEDVHDTPLRSANFVPLGLGVDCIDHSVPFQTLSKRQLRVVIVITDCYACSR